MSLAAAPRRDLQRWKRRSRLIGVLRKVLPAAIALLLFGLAGQVVWTSLHAAKSEAPETRVPIRMLNPRFFGRDEQGRSFMISAREAMRDERDLKRVTLQQPMVALGMETTAPSRVSANSGVYAEGDRILRLSGDVRIEDGQGYRFLTSDALVDTRAGTVVGDQSMIGEGPVAQVASDAYAVRDKGDRVVFKGGVRARITPQ